MKKFITILTLFSLLLLTSCGTDTGNPADLPVNQTPSLNEPFTSTICQKIKSCGWEADTCGNTIYNDINIGSKIGSPFTDLKSLSHIYNELGFETGSRIQIVEANRNLCLSSIASLSCSSAILSNAFNPSGSTPYENVYLIFNANSICEEIVKKK